MDKAITILHTNGLVREALRTNEHIWLGFKCNAVSKSVSACKKKIRIITKI